MEKCARGTPRTIRASFRKADGKQKIKFAGDRGTFPRFFYVDFFRADGILLRFHLRGGGLDYDRLKKCAGALCGGGARACGKKETNDA